MAGSCVDNKDVLPPPIIVLTGLTASGKTTLAIHWAQQLKAQIINVDSALFYQGLDIGSAKPTLTERRGVTHHLIDHLKPTETYSVARFLGDVSPIVDKAKQEGIPLIFVGGTMLYLSALLHGLSDIPATSDAIRLELETEYQQHGNILMHQQLQQCDPVSAARLHPNDKQRVMRALAIYRSTNINLSTWQTDSKPLIYPDLSCALVPTDRQWHRNQIIKRLDYMLENGFEAEIKKLMLTPSLTKNSHAMRSIGYKQWWAYRAGDCSREEAYNNTITATYQLAKRQRTWLNQFPQMLHISPQNIDTITDVKALLSKYGHTSQKP